MPSTASKKAKQVTAMESVQKTSRHTIAAKMITVRRF